MRLRACCFPVSPTAFVGGGMVSADEDSLRYLSYSEATNRELGILEVLSMDASASKGTGGRNYPKRNSIRVWGENTRKIK